MWLFWELCPWMVIFISDNQGRLTEVKTRLFWWWEKLGVGLHDRGKANLSPTQMQLYWFQAQCATTNILPLFQNNWLFKGLIWFDGFKKIHGGHASFYYVGQAWGWWWLSVAEINVPLSNRGTCGYQVGSSLSSLWSFLILWTAGPVLGRSFFLIDNQGRLHSKNGFIWG